VTSKPEASKAKKGVSRRTVVVGTAWAVPAIVVASAAPAMALSGPVTFTGRACKSPGNPKRYIFELSVTNTTNAPLVFNAVSLVVDGVTSANVCPTTGTIAPQTTQNVVVAAGTYPDSQNGTATFNYTFGPVGGPFVAGSASTQFNALPPINNPDCQLSIPTGCFA
jgi:hypothetical protein